MATTVWGTLPKAQMDSTTIDAAIAAAIADHNADPTAHMASGQSIDVHRTNTIIDHPAGSVLADKVERTPSITTDFNGAGGLSTYGNATFGFGGVRIYTTAVNNNLSILSGSPESFGLDWTKPMYMRHIVQFVEATTHTLALIGVGCDDIGDDVSGFGFKVNDGALYAYHAQDTGSGAVFTTQAITGITVTNLHAYEAFFDPTAGTLTFFIDGTQVAQFTSGLPTLATDNVFLFEIKTHEAAAKHAVDTNFAFTQG